MKKLVFLFLSLLTAGSLFQACDNSKTYAEMLEDEKNAVNKFIKDNDIRVISLEEFERDTVTASKEAGDGYVDMFLVISQVFAVRTQVIYVGIVKFFCFSNTKHFVAFGCIQKFAMFIQ